MNLSAELDRLRILSLRDFFAHPSRHLISLAVATVCSALVVAVFGIFGSITGSVSDLADALSGHVSLEITANSSGGVPAELLKPIRRVAGVQVAAPMVFATVPVDGKSTLLIGLDPSMAAIDSRLGQSILNQEGAAAVTTGGGVIVGSGAGAQRGSSIEVMGQHLNVAMVLDSPVAAGINDGRFVIAPMRVAQTAIGRPQAYDTILIVTDDGTSVSQVRSQIDSLTQGRVITSEPLLETTKNSTLLIFMRDSTLLNAFLAVIVATFLVFNTVNMTIVRRRATFATMRAIGARSSEIWRYAIGEAFVVGVIGGLLGAPLGVLAGRAAIGSLPQVMAAALEGALSYYLPAFAIPLAVMVSIVCCVAAAMGGVHQSGRVSPIEAMGRADSRQVDEFTQPLRMSVGIISAVLLAGGAFAALRLDDIRALFAVVVFTLGGLGLFYAFAELMVAIVGFTAARMGSPGVAASLVTSRARGRVWVTTMVIIVAVSMGICTSGAMSNLVTTVSTLAAPLRTVSFFVSPTGSDELPTGPVLPADLQARIQGLPDVGKVEAGQYAYGTIGGKRVLLQGAAPNAAMPGLDSLDPATLAALFRGEGVVISRQLTKLTGAKIGGTIVLECPTGKRTVKVIGVIDFITIDAGLVAMPLDSLSQWYSRPGATFLEVQIREGANAAHARQAIAAVLPSGLQVHTGEDMYQSVMSAVAVLNNLSLALQLIVAAVIAVGTFNTFLLSVNERRREIAVFRAIGANRNFIVREVLAEMAAIGLVGGAGGAAIGLAIQYVGVAVLSGSMGLHIHYRPDPTFLVYPITAGVFCLVAAGGAAAQAARLNIVEAIGEE